MKKISTLFERDWNGDHSRVTPKVTPGCEWVLAGEGVATRKLDGTCCLLRAGKLYKRRELPANTTAPEGFEVADYDTETGKTVGWVAVSATAPEDRWHREAFVELMRPDRPPASEGTYELCGPKIQGNPEGFVSHVLLPHGVLREGEDPTTDDRCPRDFEGLRTWLDGRDIEGLVFWHPDGRKAKIKLKDFGLKRKESAK
jgi:hypothetical protein